MATTLRILLPAVLAVIFCVLAGAAQATNAPNFLIQGRIYCDTCRAGFETNLTDYLEGAKVSLECRHFVTGSLERSVDVEDICEVVLVQSPLADCIEVAGGRDRARVVLAQDIGICDNVRFANPIGFLKDTPLPICGELLKQYTLTDDDEV